MTDVTPSKTPLTDALIQLHLKGNEPISDMEDFCVADELAFDPNTLANFIVHARQMEADLSAAKAELAKLADERDNLLGINAAWARDFKGEKERGDLWMADCKKAEAAASQGRADAEVSNSPRTDAAEYPNIARLPSGGFDYDGHYAVPAEVSRQLEYDAGRCFKAAFDALQKLNDTRSTWNGPIHQAAAILRYVTEPKPALKGVSDAQGVEE